MSERSEALWVANPSETAIDAEGNALWFVWNAAQWPPTPVFSGSMEVAGMVADVLQSREEGKRLDRID